MLLLTSDFLHKTPIPSTANTIFKSPMSVQVSQKRHSDVYAVLGYSEGFYSTLEAYSVNINYKSALI